VWVNQHSDLGFQISKAKGRLVVLGATDAALETSLMRIRKRTQMKKSAGGSRDSPLRCVEGLVRSGELGSDPATRSASVEFYLDVKLARSNDGEKFPNHREPLSCHQPDEINSHAAAKSAFDAS
jgi:hypothetical protein